MPDHSKPKVLIDLAEYEHLKACEKIAQHPSANPVCTEIYRTSMSVLLNTLDTPHRMKVIDYVRTKGMLLDRQIDNTYILKPVA